MGISWIVAILGWSASLASVGLASHKWKHRHLQTCWLDDVAVLEQLVPRMQGQVLQNQLALPIESDRRLVQTTIESAYSIGQTGIEFQGFLPCPKDEQALRKVSVLLLWRSDPLEPESRSQTVGRTSMIGSPYSYTPSWNELWTGSKRYSVVSIFPNRIQTIMSRNMRETLEDLKRVLGGGHPIYLGALDDQEKIVDAAVLDALVNSLLHEFGHVVGLGHERQRKDSPASMPKFCAGMNFNETEAKYDQGADTFHTQPDLFSVLDDCADRILSLKRLAKTICENRERLFELTPISRDGLPALRAYRSLSERCPFIRGQDLRVTYSERDLAGIRALYLGNGPQTPAQVDYRNNPSEQLWSEVFEGIPTAAYLN